jgi:cellulose biosynthesis protein BcsQ
MQTVAGISQKGGAGKTMLAIHLAVAALQDGRRVRVKRKSAPAKERFW